MVHLVNNIELCFVWADEKLNLAGRSTLGPVKLQVRFITNAQIIHPLQLTYNDPNSTGF